MNVAPCTETGCSPRCSPTCADGTCAVGRKHFTQGGVCCISCFDYCARCGGAFYVEDLRMRPEDYESAELDVDRFCHCCAIAEGMSR
jgi:hypothetical protein